MHFRRRFDRLSTHRLMKLHIYSIPYLITLVYCSILHLEQTIQLLGPLCLKTQTQEVAFTPFIACFWTTDFVENMK